MTLDSIRNSCDVLYVNIQKDTAVQSVTYAHDLTMPITMPMTENEIRNCDVSAVLHSCKVFFLEISYTTISPLDIEQEMPNKTMPNPLVDCFEKHIDSIHPTVEYSHVCVDWLAQRSREVVGYFAIYRFNEWSWG